jgi:hypothetical protein
MKFLLSVLLLSLNIGCVQDVSSSSSSSSTSTTIKDSFEGWFQTPTTLDIQDPEAREEFIKKLTPVPESLKTNFYVILDGSSSMDSSSCAGGSTKEKVAKKALEEFSKILPKDFNLGLMAFDKTGITERLPLGVNNRGNFIQALNRVGANSGTPLHSSIKEGLKRLAIQANKQSGYGEYHLVLVTDGDPSIGEDPTTIVRYITKNTPVVVHTLGFCIGSGHVLNTDLVNYKKATSPDELVKGLKEVITETSTFSL